MRWNKSWRKPIFTPNKLITSIGDMRCSRLVTKLWCFYIRSRFKWAPTTSCSIRSRGLIPSLGTLMTMSMWWTSWIAREFWRHSLWWIYPCFIIQMSHSRSCLTQGWVFCKWSKLKSWLQKFFMDKFDQKKNENLPKKLNKNFSLHLQNDNLMDCSWNNAYWKQNIWLGVSQANKSSN